MEDNQEVFTDTISPITVNIDLNERLEPDTPHEALEQNDLAAFREHLDEVVAVYDLDGNRISGAEGQVEVISAGISPVPRCNRRDIPPYEMTAIQTLPATNNVPGDTRRPVRSAPRQEVDFTALFLGLIRYSTPDAGATSDIVVTVAVPHVAGEYDPALVDIGSKRFETPLMEKGRMVADRILRTLEVVDDGLFGAD